MVITPMPIKAELDISYLKIFAASWNMQGRTPTY